MAAELASVANEGHGEEVRPPEANDQELRSRDYWEVCSTSARVLAELEGLATAQKRMERALGEIRQELSSVAGVLHGAPLDPASPMGEQDRWQRRTSQQDSQASVAGGDAAAEGLVVVESEGAKSSAGLSFTARCGFEAALLPMHWPATVQIRRGMEGGACKGLAKTSQAAHDNAVTSQQLILSNGRTVCYERSISGEVKRNILKNWMVSPNSNFHLVYSLVTVCILFQDLTITPMVLAWDIPIIGWLHKAAWISCGFWTVDLVMSFLTGFHSGEQLEMRPARVAMRYLRTWLIPDLTLLVFDWISLLYSVIDDESNGSQLSIRILRFAKLGKLVRIVGLLRMMKGAKLAEEFLEKNISEWYRITLRCMAMVTATLWVNHIIGCAWFAVGRLGVSDTGLRWTSTVTEYDGQVMSFMEANLMYQYITAIHWSVAQFTLGSIEISCMNTGERIFNILCLSIGLVFGSTLVSMLSARMVDYQMMMNDKNQKLRELRRFLRENDVHQSVAHLVQRQAAERLEVQERIKEEEVQVLQLVSRSLRGEVRFEMFRRYLSKHPLFRYWLSVDQILVHRLCVEAVDFVLLRSSDDLFVAGTCTDKAYYLCRGGLQYIQEPETSPVNAVTEKSVNENSWLCEAALWSHWTHVGTAKANVACQVLAINADGMLLVHQRARQLRVLSLEYCRVFHSRVVSARPPLTSWPTDLEVPLTDYSDIVMSMDVEVQVMVGVSAVEEVEARQWLVGRNPAKVVYDKLKDEIRKGKCFVVTNSEGQPERIVSVAILQLQDSQGRIFVELGRSTGGGQDVSTACQLPGAKPKRGESSDEVASRLLSQLGLSTSIVEQKGMERHLEWKQSREFGMLTKYVRHVHCMKLLLQKVCLPAVVIPPAAAAGDLTRSRSERWNSRQAQNRRTSESVTSRCDYITTELEKVFKVWQSDKHVFYSWLSPQRLEHYQSPSGEKDLAAWLSWVALCSVEMEDDLFDV